MKRNNEENLLGQLVAERTTALEETNQQLRLSEERFRSLMEQSPLAIEVLTPDGRITQVNPAWLRLWGVTEEQAGQTLASYNMLTDQQAIDLGVAPLIKKAFEGESVVLPPIKYSATLTAEEFELEGITGNSPWIQCYLCPIKNEKNEVVSVLNTYMDITDVKRTEDALRKKQDALARAEQVKRAERNRIRQHLRKLTPREHEIMTHVIAGLLNKQIAAALGISLETVKIHRGRVMRKLGVGSVAELVRLCEKAGIASAESRVQ
jgi:RNA polymerase sigma factor (sigma-70 family)